MKDTAGGQEKGASWKDGLDQSPWEDYLAKGEHLCSGECGVRLRSAYKRVSRGGACVGIGRNTVSRLLFRRRELSSAANSVSSARNSVSSHLHTNNRLKGTH